MRISKEHIFFDSSFGNNEQLPRKFSIEFCEVFVNNEPRVQVLYNGNQIGDIINDNSYENDYYRYHDVFHYTFAAILGWSPCSRALLKRKRKSNPQIDDVEDGARATITEEAISLIIFTEAKNSNNFQLLDIKESTLEKIKEMTETYEVRIKTTEEWKKAVYKAYELFSLLVKNRGGKIDFDMYNKTAEYIS